MIRSTLTAMVLVLVAATASAAPMKIALTAIENDDGDVRTAIAEALEGPELSLASSGKTNHAVNALKGDITELSEKQAKKLQSELEVDAIVFGTLEAKKSTKTLKFGLYVSGKKPKGFSVQFSNARSKKFKSALREKIVEKIGSVASTKSSDDDEEETAPPKKGGKTAKVDKTKKGKKPDKADKADKDDADDADDKPPKPPKKGEKVAANDKTKKGKKPDKAEKADKEDKPDEDEPAKPPKKVAKADEGGDDEGDAPRKPPKKKTASLGDDEGGGGDEVGVRAKVGVSGAGIHAANHVAVRADVGGSVSARRLTFTTTPQLASVDGVDKRPRPFKQTPVPGARFDAELYPLAFSNPTGGGAGLGITVMYDQVLKSKTTVVGGDDSGKTQTVTQKAWEVGAVYRLAFGKSNTSPNLTLGVNYGHRQFKVDRSQLMSPGNLDLPDSEYKYVAPQLGFRLPFTPAVAFVVNGEALLIQSAGTITTAEEYGKAKVFGVGGTGGLDIVVSNRFAIRVLGEFDQIGFTFTGGGLLTRNRDGNADTRDVGGALDRSFGGSATFAFLY